MTHKEIADRLRKAIADEVHPYTAMEALADQLDPPLPEPGTVVIRDDGVAGLVMGRGTVSFGANEVMWWADCGPEWKPARILADDEVPVKVPPVSEWPKNAEVMTWNYDMGYHGAKATIITRADAEKMEAEG